MCSGYPERALKVIHLAIAISTAAEDNIQVYLILFGSLNVLKRYLVTVTQKLLSVLLKQLTKYPRP